MNPSGHFISEVSRDPERRLDKIIDRVATTLEPTARGRDDRDDRDDRRDRDDWDDRSRRDRYEPRKRRRRGFLDDIFDFD